MLAPRPTPKLEDHPSSAVRDCLFNLFAATLLIGGRSSIRNLTTRHAMVTGITGIIIIIIINHVSLAVDKITLKYIYAFLSLYHSPNAPYSYFIQLPPMLYNLRDNIVRHNRLHQSLEKHNILCEHRLYFINTDCRRTTLYHEVRTPDPI